MLLSCLNKGGTANFRPFWRSLRFLICNFKNKEEYNETERNTQSWENCFSYAGWPAK